MSKTGLARIALTPGEPAGIGPDICIRIAQQAHNFEIIAVGDPELLLSRAEQLQLPLTLNKWDANFPQPQAAGSLSILPVKLAAPVTTGILDSQNSRYVLDTLRIATENCLQGRFDALVTAPVHKGIINDAGVSFSGHTEFLAAITGGHPVMMLATKNLRVALVTTHLPLKEVSSAINSDLLETVLCTLDKDLRRFFGLASPRILVCGLNPHAGENGHLGREELETIEPVIKKLNQAGLSLEGPLPADTLFTPKNLKTADAVVAMYHDQGLPVLKYSGFGQAVNITLGLPIIRTSVDHGTALELAGSGQADPGSLEVALETAHQMTRHL